MQFSYVLRDVLESYILHSKTYLYKYVYILYYHFPYHQFFMQISIQFFYETQKIKMLLLFQF